MSKGYCRVSCFKSVASKNDHKSTVFFRHSSNSDRARPKLIIALVVRINMRGPMDHNMSSVMIPTRLKGGCTIGAVPGLEGGWGVARLGPYQGG